MGMGTGIWTPGTAATAQRNEPETTFSGEVIASAPQDAGSSGMWTEA